MVKLFADRFEVVVDDEDRFALFTEFLEQVEDDRFRAGIDAGHRLVHEVNVGLLSEGAGDEDALLLSAGELPDLAGRELGHADVFESATGDVSLLAAGATEPAEAAVGSHEDGFHDVDREVPIDGGTLRDVGDATTSFFNWLSLDLDVAGECRDEAEDGFDESAFAGAVGADDGGELWLVDFEVDVPQDWLLLVGHGQVVDIKEERHNDWAYDFGWRALTMV